MPLKPTHFILFNFYSGNVNLWSENNSTDQCQGLKFCKLKPMKNMKLLLGLMFRKMRDNKTMKVNSFTLFAVFGLKTLKLYGHVLLSFAVLIL